MSALPVLLMAPPTAGTLGQKHGKKMRPAARVIIYMPIGASASVASERGHYRRNREEVRYAKYCHTTRSHEAVRQPRVLPVGAVVGHV